MLDNPPPQRYKAQRFKIEARSAPAKANIFGLSRGGAAR
jgi:hypothetical protein